MEHIAFPLSPHTHFSIRKQNMKKEQTGGGAGIHRKCGSPSLPTADTFMSSLSFFVFLCISPQVVIPSLVTFFLSFACLLSQYCSWAYSPHGDLDDLSGLNWAFLELGDTVFARESCHASVPYFGWQPWLFRSEAKGQYWAICFLACFWALFVAAAALSRTARAWR